MVQTPNNGTQNEWCTVFTIHDQNYGKSTIGTADILLRRPSPGIKGRTIAPHQTGTAANIKLSPSMSDFMKKEVTFVGIKIKSRDLKITDERVKALTELNAPSDRKSLQSQTGILWF